jgi:uncharacterized protein
MGCTARSDVNPIRAMQEADHHLAWELNQREVPHVSSETFDDFGRLCRISASAWTAVEADQPIGFLLGMTPSAVYDSPNFLWFRERFAEFLYIDRLAVDAAYRRRGIGTGLYVQAEASARALGCKLLCCEVNLRPPNPDSLEFHLRLGFEKRGEQQAKGKRVAMLVKSCAL